MEERPHGIIVAATTMACEAGKRIGIIALPAINACDGGSEGESEGVRGGGRPTLDVGAISTCERRAAIATGSGSPPGA